MPKEEPDSVTNNTITPREYTPKEDHKHDETESLSESSSLEDSYLGARSSINKTFREPDEDVVVPLGGKTTKNKYNKMLGVPSKEEIKGSRRRTLFHNKDMKNPLISTVSWGLDPITEIGKPF